MKKNYILLILLGLSIFLISCLDMTQSVSRKHGKVQTSMKFLIDKSILQLSSGLSEEETDYDKVLEEFDIDIIDQDYNTDYIDVNVAKINNTFNIGYKLDVSYKEEDLQKIPQDEKVYLPIFEKDYFEISFEDLSGNFDLEESEYTTAILSGAKYSLLINRSDFKVKKAVFIVDDEEYEDGISITTLANIDEIEFSLLLLFSLRDSVTLRVYYE